MTSPTQGPKSRRGPWSQHEDQQLVNASKQVGVGKWVEISDILKTRSPKQCRERWHQNLRPDLNHTPITAEEGRFIEDQVLKHGRRWADIARQLTNRSDNAVKNWWNGGMNRRKREERAQRDLLAPAHSAQRVQKIYRTVSSSSMPASAIYAPRPIHANEHFEHFGLNPQPHGYSSHRGWGAPHIAQIMVPASHARFEGNDPSPLNGNAPSLISDNGSPCAISPDQSPIRHYREHHHHAHTNSFSSSRPSSSATDLPASLTLPAIQTSLSYHPGYGSPVRLCSTTFDSEEMHAKERERDTPNSLSTLAIAADNFERMGNGLGHMTLKQKSEQECIHLPPLTSPIALSQMPSPPSPATPSDKRMSVHAMLS